MGFFSCYLAVVRLHTVITLGHHLLRSKLNLLKEPLDNSNCSLYNQLLLLNSNTGFFPLFHPPPSPSHLPIIWTQSLAEKEAEKKSQLLPESEGCRNPGEGRPSPAGAAARLGGCRAGAGVGAEGAGRHCGLPEPGEVGWRRARSFPEEPPRGWVVRSALTRLADLTFACFALPGVATRCQAHNTISTSVQLTLAARLTTVLLSVKTEFEY